MQIIGRVYRFYQKRFAPGDVPHFAVSKLGADQKKGMVIKE